MASANCFPRHRASAGVILVVVAGLVACSSEARSPLATCQVSSVSVTPVNPTIEVYGTGTLSANVASTGCSPAPAVDWQSTAPHIATVTATGIVTGVSAGTATISAAAEGKSGSTQVQVLRAPVASLEITPQSPSVRVGETLALTVVVKDSRGLVLTGRTITWTTLSASIVSVNQSTSAITGVSVGQGVVVATVEGISRQVNVTVAAPEVASVEVTPPTASRVVGESVQLSAAVKDANGNLLSGQSVLWSSSATAIASVSASGLVTAHALGSAVITAAVGNKSGAATITVGPPPVASISVAPTSDTLLVRESTQLFATLRDAGNNVLTGRTVTWVSISPDIASVSATGLVTGVGEGTTSITASADGKTATAAIRVINPCLVLNAPPIAVGQSINAALSTFDCRLTDNTYADVYAVMVSAGTNVQIDMTAGFDTFLILLELLINGTLVQRAFNDDIDQATTNSRITFTLVAGAQYVILANSFDPNITGGYTLRLAAAAALIAGREVDNKPGKAPITSLLKSLRVR